MGKRRISGVQAEEILDSRGNPTVEARVLLEGGAVGWASVPSGASTGSWEAVEKRDWDRGRYGGKGVLRAVESVNRVLGPAVCGLDAADTERVDRAILDADGSEDKSRLGANAALALSAAAARAAASALELPLYRFLGGAGAGLLPVPMMNVLNGGLHADNSLDVQEFLVLPVGAVSFREALRQGAEVYHTLGTILREKGCSTAVGDEGGYAPDLPGDREALALLVEAVRRAGYRPGRDFVLAIDAAASGWQTEKKGVYHLPRSRVTRTAEELIQHYEALAREFPLVSIEDGLGEEDWEGWRKLTRSLGERVQLVGDDLFVTNTRRLHRGIQENCANAALIKPNQIGTLTETLEAMDMARRAGYGLVVSHRSGETEDPLIADLAVAMGTGQIKAGAPCRGERVSKYNRLLRIEAGLGGLARYAGTTFRET